jgi:hypothetical protein
MKGRVGVNMQRDLILLLILVAVATRTFAQTLPTVGQFENSTLTNCWKVFALKTHIYISLERMSTYRLQRSRIFEPATNRRCPIA